MLPMSLPPATPIPDRPILVVDDDAKIVRLVRTYLERDGFSVVTAADGPAALDAIERHRPALVVLDLMLPELDGRAVIRAVRRDDEAAATPILIISARGSTVDRIAGLEDGADDYLPKPFSPAELVLRVKSILRRTAATAALAAPRRSAALASSGRAPLRHADLLVDPDRHEVTRDGQAIPLTRVEFRLLQTILEADGRVLSRDQLLDAVYGQDQADVLDRTVDVHIGRLRDKLGDDADRPRYIATVRGVGYRAAPANGAEAPGEATAPGGPDVIGRGIAARIALAALVSAAVGLAILAVGVTVVGAESFKALMAEAGVSADHAQRMYDQSVSTVVVAAVVVAALASIGLAVLMARMLARPLAEVGAAARRVAAGDYAARVPREGPEELVSLADSFNQMAASLERQEPMRRDFIANAAHELRTPLTNLQGYLEALRDGVITADRATYESLWDEAERLVRLSHSLDALAEGDAATTRPNVTELDLVGGHPSSPRPRPADARASRPAARRRPPRAAAGARQPGPSGPGAGQSHLERRSLHAGRRDRHRPGRASPGGPAGLDREHRRRHPGR